MPVNTIISDHAYVQKPTQLDTRILVNRLTPQRAQSIEIAELANRIGQQGYACRPAVCGRTEAFWIEQQLFIMDFDHIVDHNMTHDQVIEMYRGAGFPACFSYWSYSHRDVDPRFHVAFCIDRPIRSISQAKTVAHHLFKISGGIADPIYKQLYMLSYGGIGLVCTDYAIIPFERIEALHPIVEDWPASREMIRSDRNIDDALAVRADCIRARDIEGLRTLILRNGNNNPLGE